MIFETWVVEFAGGLVLSANIQRGWIDSWMGERPDIVSAFRVIE